LLYGAKSKKVYKIHSAKDSMERDVIKKVLGIGIFIGLAIVAFLILKPFITPILTALILSYYFHPLYRKANKRFKKPTLIALLICIVVALIMVALAVALMRHAVAQLIDFYAYIQTTDILAPIKVFFSKITPVESTSQLSVFFDQAVEKIVSSLFNFISKTLVNLPFLILQVFVMFFVMFYLIREGDSLYDYSKDILPFKKKIRQRFSVRFKEITRGFLYGMIAVGLVQGALAGVGFYIFGASQPFILMILAIFAAMIPFIGTWIVWLPVGTTMLIKGSTFAGIGLILYGAIVVGYIDNLIRPLIVGKMAKMSNAIVLLGILGGLRLFGLIGIIVGPLVLDYLIIFIEFYRTKQIKKLV